jgi:hypothetical protein
MVLHWHERDTDDQTIGRLLGIPVPEVQAIIASAARPAPSASAMPLFVQPPVFGGGDDSLDGIMGGEGNV